MIITLKIDVTKIDKARLFEGKNGAKYLDITRLENRDGQDRYGNDFMVVQSVTKEERESGKRGPILGNGKIIGGKNQPTKTSAPAKPPHETGEDVPF